MSNLAYEAYLYLRLDENKTIYFGGIKGTTRHSIEDFKQNRVTSLYNKFHINFHSRLRRQLPNFTNDNLVIMNGVLFRPNLITICFWYGVTAPIPKIIRCTTEFNTIGIKYHCTFNLDAALQIGRKNIILELCNYYLSQVNEEEFLLSRRRDICFIMEMKPRHQKELPMYTISLTSMDSFQTPEDWLFAMISDVIDVKIFFTIRRDKWVRNSIITIDDITNNTTMWTV